MLHEHVKQIRVNVPGFLEFLHDAGGLRQLHALFVRPVSRCQRFENISNAHHPGLDRHLVALEALGVPFAVHALMVAARVFRHTFEVPGPGQLLQHLDGGHNVVVDGGAFALGQRATANAQVFEFIGGQERHHLAVFVAPDALVGDRLHPGNRRVVHELGALVGGAQKGAI